ncbi:MAG: amidase domain-containing protein [Clostridiaceae bacterium]|nr:amidase domain-containing protein [Clostridiaceae bacterium]
MMKVQPYNRDAALAYAHRWAFDRNPSYLDFSRYGGDCTNYISQCLYAACKTMNPKPVFGWYYYNSYNRTASWTGVQYLYDFLINNNGAGPFAQEVPLTDLVPGDIIQLSFNGESYGHSLFVVEKGKGFGSDNIKIATHTFDRDYYPLSEYKYQKCRGLHIIGYRR